MNNETAIYFGQKGYTIYKENLEIKEQELIRKELTVSPYVPKNSLQKPSSFQIYRESPKKCICQNIMVMENMVNLMKYD